MSTFTMRLDEAWTEPGDVRVLAFDAPADLATEAEAGQFVQVEVPGTDEKRTLTMASAPHEPRVLLATMIEHGEEASDAKSALDRLKPGDEVPASAARGRFTLQADDADATHVVIPIGIGVTAARSLVSEAAEKHRDLKLRVVHAPVNGAHPFAEDFSRFTGRANGFHYNRVDEAPASVDALKALVEDVAGARYYVSGPAADVQRVRKLLDEAGVPRERVKLEIFAGY